MAIQRPDDDAPGAVDALIARAMAAEARVGARLTAMAKDVALVDGDRLDDRTRAALLGRLAATVAAVEAAFRTVIDERLTFTPPAALLMQAEPVLGAVRPILLKDAAFVEELIGTVQLDLIAGSVTPHSGGEADRPSLLVRLADCPDVVVARAAADLLAADNVAGGNDAPVALPAHIADTLVWQVAAALRESVVGLDVAVDRLLVDATMQVLAAHHESSRAEAAALRLSATIDARPDELPELLHEALGDRRLTFFVALLAHAARLAYEDARSLVLDPEGAPLWLLLRAADVDRATIAQIGLVLCEGDPRRDLERFADELDTIMAVDPNAAAAAVAPLTLPAGYRRARRALGMGVRR